MKNQEDSLNLSFSSLGEGGVCIRLNLMDYVNAIEDREKDAEHYTKMRRQLREQLTTDRGYYFFRDVFQHALGGLSEEDRDKIEKTPAYHYVSQSFIEILKNAIDETILAYFEEDRDPMMQLELRIDTSDPHTITFKLSDHGRGFNDEFIKRMRDPELREHYILGMGSHKQSLIRDEKEISTELNALKSRGLSLSSLMGGQGRGLRNLLALSDHGADLVYRCRLKERFEVPDVSNVSLDNDPAGGAVISIQTSWTPLKELHTEATPFKLFDVPIDRFKKDHDDKENIENRPPNIMRKDND